MTLNIRRSPSGRLIDDDIIAGNLRYDALADSTGISGVIQSYEPADFGPQTTDLRIALGGNTAVLGMPLAPGQELTLRLSRTVPEAFSLTLVHEASGAAADSERFNTPNNLPLILRRGEGVLIRNTGSRNNVQAIGDYAVRLLGKNQGTVSATNATTELSCGGVLTFLPNILVAHMSFEFEADFEFIHTAAGTPIIDVGFASNGVVGTFHSITPAASAGTFSGTVRAFARLVGTGVTSYRSTVQWKAPFGSTLQDQIGGATAFVNVDTTAQSTLELRMRMQTAVPGNTLAIFNAFAQLLG